MNSFSGPSVHIKEVIEGLERRGHEVEYLAGCHVSGSLLSQAYQRLRFSLQVRSKLRSSRPDWVYQREQLVDPFVAEVCWREGVSYAVEVNGLVVKELARNGARVWTRAFARLMQAWCLKRAAAIVVPAANWIKLLIAEYGLNSSRFAFIQNGVNLEEFAPSSRQLARSSCGIQQDDLVVGFLGSIYRNYDFQPILLALQRLRSKYPRLRLIVTGPGPRRKEFWGKVVALGLEGVVELRDPIPHSQSCQLIACYDLCLMPYCSEVLQENNGIFSMKLQEYTACGRPLIAHDRLGSDSYDYVVQFGWAFDPDIPDSAVAALDSALGSAEAREQKGGIARRYAEGLSWDAVSEKIEKLLLESKS